MRIDPRADAIFRKQYHLKGSQVKPMRDTFNYQGTVLRLYLGDLVSIFKVLLKSIFKRGGENQ